MPIVSSNYKPPFVLKNGHISTIYAGLFRRVEHNYHTRERISLPDGDFLDLDWSYSTAKSKKMVILIHGLEGNSQRAYMAGSAKHFTMNGFNVCSMNLRGCSGETNLLYRSYHSGATEDLEAVINHTILLKKYTDIYLNGFSLGGNLALKYLGESKHIPLEIKGAIAISVPCNLHDSLQQLLLPKNALYAARFKKRLIKTLQSKQKRFPDKILHQDIKKIQTLLDFDNVYTSKAHGFKNAIDYYQKSSCLQFLPNITAPTLLINAKNDSFLGKKCFPITPAKNNPNLYLEMPDHGGHVGFYGKNDTTYTEERALNFFKEIN